MNSSTCAVLQQEGGIIVKLFWALMERTKSYHKSTLINTVCARVCACGVCVCVCVCVCMRPAACVYACGVCHTTTHLL